MSEETLGCARVTGTVGGETTPTGDEPAGQEDTQREVRMTARVGKQAPDFTAPAYHKGGFTSVRLSDHAGEWVFLCFYPGDFTFV
jgi:peroxiredoxin (alkyl hydroperoxide reductase subunit C)